MSRRAYSEINLHITWHTKGNLPLINLQIEPKLYDFLRKKMLETPEIFVHAVGGIENHVHIAVSVPPQIQPAEWIGQLKGASAYFVNQGSNHKLLEWQNGYGIVSFGTKDLKWVVRYIQNQKEHHKSGKIYKRLESVEKEDGYSPAKKDAEAPCKTIANPAHALKRVAIESRITAIENGIVFIENGIVSIENRFVFIENRFVSVENRFVSIENRIVPI